MTSRMEVAFVLYAALVTAIVLGAALAMVAVILSEV